MTLKVILQVRLTTLLMWVMMWPTHSFNKYLRAQLPGIKLSVKDKVQEGEFLDRTEVCLKRVIWDPQALIASQSLDAITLPWLTLQLVSKQEPNSLKQWRKPVLLHSSRIEAEKTTHSAACHMPQNMSKGRWDEEAARMNIGWKAQVHTTHD